MKGYKTCGQFSRYAVVGLVANTSLYLAYLGLTAIGIGPKSAMSILYVFGVLLTFTFNRRWSFKYQGAPMGALLRYFTIYGLGYLFSLAALWIAVDQKGLPHYIVQGVVIVTLAVYLFLMQKFWVFRSVSVKLPAKDPTR